MALEHAMTEQATATCLDRAENAAERCARGIAGRTTFASEQDLRAHKRQQQARDLESLRPGRASETQMSWFSGGRARACRLINSPY